MPINKEERNWVLGLLVLLFQYIYTYIYIFFLRSDGDGEESGCFIVHIVSTEVQKKKKG